MAALPLTALGHGMMFWCCLHQNQIADGFLGVTTWQRNR